MTPEGLCVIAYLFEYVCVVGGCTKTAYRFSSVLGLVWVLGLDSVLGSFQWKGVERIEKIKVNCIVRNYLCTFAPCSRNYIVVIYCGAISDCSRGCLCHVLMNITEKQWSVLSLISCGLLGLSGTNVLKSWGANGLTFPMPLIVCLQTISRNDEKIINYGLTRTIR